MAHEAVNPAVGRMWHLDHNNPYDRAMRSQVRNYMPNRHSYVDQTSAMPNLNRHYAQSLESMDNGLARPIKPISPHSPYAPHLPQPTSHSTHALHSPHSAHMAHSSHSPHAAPSPHFPSAPTARPTRPGSRFSRSGHRSSSTRNGRPSSFTASQDDFVFFSPNKPPPAGVALTNKVLPEENEDDDDDDDDDDDENDALSSDKRLRRTGKVANYGRKCRDCMTRVPYATLIATMMCCVGVGVFCGTMYRGTTLTLRMFEEVFKLRVIWDRDYRVEPVQLTFMVVGAGMGGLGLMILFVGCLSTGDTRNKVYRTWRGRVGGRISCAIFMGITYLLSLAWLLMFAAIIIVTLFYTLAWLQCQYIPQNDCIDYNQFSFLFPEGTPEEDKRVCDGEKKLFCKDYVNNAEIMFILASVSSFLVILSLVHYLMCLAANYAHIKDQEKFMDLQEIQFLQESEMSTLPKDRF
ncbi:neuronal membrane glycoprotein M6-a-like isoform X1 [Penaeus monodon]|uniref:neuronal membrane glycoprotein M6-a-like isoform X1 n=1 Tax=Penaeus monodon TaxID=6687 RepID=UPI0018A78895|nr:neuronal membrane glycoprotein M6-a-like isoform X1 [Penaeus monodon]XP_037782749.1 neuronal membrane glycoprotein M6-a-like isoform X1 [Penaeus monodon]XP_037782750.1 neuronal membrane glycoprotein M6-a-like isoform X1 [Penaeus monodon]